jgi:CheY-like chemotaxis protein
MVRLLKRAGHEPVVVGNKADTISAMVADPADLVLMDIGIPDEDGGEFNNLGGLEAAEFLKNHPSTRHVPIIATSASSMPDETRRFRAAGCDDVQSKPIDHASLLGAIANCLCGPAPK